MAKSLSGLFLPNCLQTGQREEVSSKQAKGAEVLPRPAAWGRGSVMLSPFSFLAKLTEWCLALSQTPVAEQIIHVSMGVHPFRDRTPRSGIQYIQYIQLTCSRRKGVQGKEGRKCWMESGLKHPYSNTPPQTALFPNGKQETYMMPPGHQSKQVKDKT